MSILIVCDVCGESIDPDDAEVKTIIHKEALCDGAKLEDICNTCTSAIGRSVADCIAALAAPHKADIDKEPVICKTKSRITRMSDGHVDHSNSRAMRRALCKLVDKGRYTSREICSKLAAEFTLYKGPQSFAPRISDLLYANKAHMVTRFLPDYVGKVAMKDKRTAIITWRN